VAIKLAFVDDHPTLLRGLATLFDAQTYEIVGSGGCADDLVELAGSVHPDVCTVDLSMPGDVLAAIARVARTQPTKIIVFTAYANTDLAMKALEAGAHGFVLKGRPSDDLFDAITAVMRGDLYISPDFSPKIISAARNRSRREQELKSAQLTTRERQIVDCLMEAKTNKEIARTLNLSEKTVKHYMTNLMGKLNARNRLEVVLAIRSGEQAPIGMPQEMSVEA
jgi:two-component system nitrate/nitrite response regulator NarL